MSVAVIMITCQKYHQAWNPFFILFKKYWPDCPYNVYMVSDFGEYEGINNITLNKDLGFSSNLKTALNSIEEDKVIYFQEDYFFEDYFDTQRIEKYCDYVDDKLPLVRLAPCPGPTKPWENDSSLGILCPKDNYRVSTQTAIWNKNFMLSVLVDGETGGQFEIQGTKRIEKIDKTLLSVWRGESPTPYYITGIVRNKWQDGALELLKKEGIETSHIQKVIK